MKTRRACLVLLTVLAAVLLPSCSLFEEEWPEEQPSFQLYAEPSRIFQRSNDNPFVVEWSREAALTGKAHTIRFPAPYDNGAGWNVPYTDLVLDDSAQVLQLKHVKLEEVPLEVGRQYLFEAAAQVTPTVGFPSLRVTDDTGLAFFGTSMHLWSLPEFPILLTPEGWTITKKPSQYDRNVKCGTRTSPIVVEVEYEGERIRLLQGQTARVGGYIVQCRKAIHREQISPPSDDCGVLDGYTNDVSLVIFRAPT